MKKFLVLSIVSTTLFLSFLGSSCSRKDEPKVEEEKGQQNNPSSNNPTQPKSEDAGQTSPENNQPKSNRPSDADLSRNLKVQWSNASVFPKDLDLDNLILKNDNSQVNLSELLKTIKIQSLGTDNQVYDLNEEDRNHVQISGLHYDGQNITFRLEYEGTGVQTQQSLRLDKDLYFAGKVTLHQEEVAKYYMQGVAQLFAIYQDLLDYDRTKYAVSLSAQPVSISPNANKFSISLTLNTHGKEDGLATFTKEISGFKSVNNLLEDLQLTPTHKLVERIKKYKDKSEDNIYSYLLGTIKVWIKEVQFNLASNQLSLAWEGDILRGGTGREEGADIYLANPQFTLLGVTKSSDKVVLKLSFNGANDYAFEKGKTYELSVKI